MCASFVNFRLSSVRNLTLQYLVYKIWWNTEILCGSFWPMRSFNKITQIRQEMLIKYSCSLALAAMQGTAPAPSPRPATWRVGRGQQSLSNLHWKPIAAWGTCPVPGPRPATWDVCTWAAAQGTTRACSHSSAWCVRPAAGCWRGWQLADPERRVSGTDLRRDEDCKQELY